MTEGLPATAANRFHKELRFFFSLLKRKKEAKKEKSSHFTCTARFRAIPHKERLGTLHAICLQISLQSLFRIF
ncbi:hypothetical protein, partial [uncultured Ruminococcus sp.]|uniref:hypothetical protein n=1 Tax=uncultured Ruminococcus sp. TaxID=165186 RepID=UPI002591FE54